MLLAKRTAKKPALDGNLCSDVWGEADRSPAFVDMATGGPALLKTEASILWDDENLYVGFWIQEPFPTALQDARDSLVFRENDVEVFIDGGDCYYEFEINALGTVYEVFFIWRDAYSERFNTPEFDVHRRKAFSFGGDFDRTEAAFWTGTHPRGTRWAFTDWDMEGMQSAVTIDGVLNDPTVRSTGWKVELAFPWASMQHLANGRSLPPTPGDVWKIFLGRFQKIELAGKQVQAAWCVTPHGKYDTHQPESFTEVTFIE